MLDRVLAPTGNQLAVANQADRAVTLEREPLVRLGLVALGPRSAAGCSSATSITSRLARQLATANRAERRRTRQARSSPDGRPRRRGSGATMIVAGSAERLNVRASCSCTSERSLSGTNDSLGVLHDGRMGK